MGKIFCIVIDWNKDIFYAKPLRWDQEKNLVHSILDKILQCNGQWLATSSKTEDKTKSTEEKACSSGILTQLAEQLWSFLGFNGRNEGNYSVDTKDHIIHVTKKEFPLKLRWLWVIRILRTLCLMRNKINNIWQGIGRNSQRLFGIFWCWTRRWIRFLHRTASKLNSGCSIPINTPFYRSWL